MLKPSPRCSIKPIFFTKDCRINLEALVLGTLAEHALKFTVAPALTNIVKEFAKDPQALQKCSMNQTSNSCKMRYGFTETPSPIKPLKILKIHVFL